MNQHSCTLSGSTSKVKHVSVIWILIQQTNLGGDVAQLVEHQTGTPLSRFSSPVRLGIFFPVSFQRRLSYTYSVCRPSCTITCINICAHIKGLVVHVRVQWIMEMLKHPGSLLEEHWTRGQKVASSNPSWSSRKIYFPRVNFIGWLLFSVRSIPMLSQLHIKDPCHSAKSAVGRLHLNTHTPLTQGSQSWLTMPLSRHSVGTR